jgi:hypothetical protein
LCVLCEDFRQAPTSAQFPVPLAEDFRQAATSAHWPLLKLWLLLRHPFTMTTSGANGSKASSICHAAVWPPAAGERYHCCVVAVSGRPAVVRQ